MKKFTYLATALLVLAGASSCQKNADVQEPGLQPSGKMRTVTIQAGQGATKTSVSGGTLTWSENDKLYIVPTTGSIGAVALDITSGAGTSTGTFTGDIDDAIKNDTELYGWCGGDWKYNGSGSFSINMPSEQTYVENGLAENAYPSIGTGSIKNGINNLSNPFGVLKLNVKGESTYSVKSITVTSTANNLAGEFTVVPGGSVSGGGEKSITLTCTDAVELSSTGKLFYIVVPAVTYAANDLKVTVTMSDKKAYDYSLGETTVEAGKATDPIDVQGTPKLVTKGKAKAKIGDKMVDVDWVQLWENGPKWAVFNVGATAIGEYGGYYCWGGFYQNGSGITWQDDHNKGSESLAWNADSTKATDTATNIWGSNWQMPKSDDFANLISYCKYSKKTAETSGYGVVGMLVTGEKNYSSNSVFFPYSGICKDGTVSYATSKLYYWSSSTKDQSAKCLSDYVMNSLKIGIEDRNQGFSVRAILHEAE